MNQDDESVPDYDTRQYNDLMYNFEHMIQSTQDKLNQHKKHDSDLQYTPQLHQSICQCGLDQTVIRLRQQIEQLEMQIQLQKPIGMDTIQRVGQNDNLQFMEQCKNQMIAYVAQIEQLEQLVNELQNEVQYLQDQLSTEKQEHSITAASYERVQRDYDDFQRELTLRERKEIQITDKITTEFQQLALDSTKLKNQCKTQSKQIDNLKLALNQSYLNQEQLIKRVSCNSVVTQTDEQQSNTQLNERKRLVERINTQATNIDKFITQFVDQKKIRNKSSIEVKFYNELQNRLEQLKQEHYKIRVSYQEFIDEFDNRDETIRNTLQQNLDEIVHIKQQADAQISALNVKLQQTHQQAESTANQLNIDNAELNSQLTQLQEELQDMRNQNSELSELIESKDYEIHQYDTQFQLIKSEFQQSKESANRQISQLGYQLEQTLSQYQEANVKLSTSLNKITLLEQEIYVLTQKVTEQNTQILQSHTQFKEQKQLLLNTQIENDKLNMQNTQLDRNNKQLFESVERFQTTQKEIYDKYSDIQRSYGKLEEEHANLKQYSLKIQADLQDRNVQVQDLKLLSQQLELQCYQTPVMDKSVIEHSYMSSKIDDLEIVLKDKDQKYDEMEKLYHLTNYELRMLQEYHDSLQQENDLLKQQILKLSQELENRSIQQVRGSKDNTQDIFAGESCYLLQQKILCLEDQLKLAQMTNQNSNSKQGTVQVKILSGEIQRLSAIIQQNDDKIKDLEYFIEEMIKGNENNKLLAKQILIAQAQKGNLNNLHFEKTQQKKKKDSSEQKFIKENYRSTETFGISVSQLEL